MDIVDREILEELATRVRVASDYFVAADDLAGGVGAAPAGVDPAQRHLEQAVDGGGR